MNEKWLWTLLTAVGVVGALVIGLGLKKLQAFIRTKDETFQSPLLSFRYKAQDVNALVEKLDGMGLGKLFDRFSLMMLLMMAEVLIILMVVVHNITNIAWLAQVMYVLTGVIWAAGSAESIALRKAPAVSSISSLIKWAAFALWTLAMFIGLFIRSTAI